MKQRKIHNRFLITVLSFIIFYSYAFSQSFLLKDVPHDNLSVDFRFIHPFYKTSNELSTLSGTYDLNISVPIGGKWNINSLIPIIIYKNKVDYQLYNYNYSYEYSKNVLGNIYVGVQTRDSTSSNKARYFSFGVFLPTADKNDAGSANYFGLLTNYYDLQKYLLETVALYSNLAFRWYLENGIRFGLDIGPQYVINISGKGSGGNNFFMHYGLSTGIKIADFIFKSEFIGILILTGDAEDFSNRFLNFLSLGLSYTNFIIKPSIFYQFNFHELYKDISSGSLGIKLSYILE
jgi:hypothetical protein